MLFCAPAARSQPACTTNDRPVINPPASPPLPLVPNPPADDIETLRANVLELQERLDRLSPPSAGRVGTPTVRPTEFHLSETTNHTNDTNEERLLPYSCHSCDSWFPALGEPCQTEGGARWPLYARWNYGLELASRDDAFRVHVGGMLQFDFGWNAASQAVQFGPGGTGDFQDGGVMRRARIRIEGAMFEHIDWVAEYDFANTVENDNGTSTQTIGTPSFINAWGGINDIPLVGTIRMGWMKEPISFEYLKSGGFLNFMERTPGTNSFFTRSVGVMFLNTTENERVTWAFGVFHAENDNFGFGFGDGQYSEVGRLTWLPWYEDEGQRLLHLGIGAKHEGLDQNQIDYKGRPSVRTMPGSQEPAL